MSSLETVLPQLAKYYATLRLIHKLRVRVMVVFSVKCNGGEGGRSLLKLVHRSQKGLEWTIAARERSCSARD